MTNEGETIFFVNVEQLNLIQAAEKVQSYWFQSFFTFALSRTQLTNANLVILQPWKMPRAANALAAIKVTLVAETGVSRACKKIGSSPSAIQR